MRSLPRTYDALLEQRLSVPIEFARALVWMESGFNPKNKTGNYWGLFQVGPENLADYNRAHGTSWTADDRLDPDKNAQIWAWEFERIRAAITGAGVVEDWNDREWVSLVIAGWNSGYSEKAGVRHVLDYLKAHNLPLTHDNVFLYGKRAGAVWSLQQENSKGAAKYRWQRDVAAAYAAEAAAGGNAAILANLTHWTTRRMPIDKLTPPGVASTSAVAAQAAPLPRPESAQGRTSGSGGALLLLILLLVAAGRKN